MKGVPTIPRLWLEWRYPGAEKPVEQWVEVEVDCDKGTIETLHFDDVRLWDKPPDLGIPISKRQSSGTPETNRATVKPGSETSLQPKESPRWP